MLCYKCGATGHKKVDCKAPKSAWKSHNTAGSGAIVRDKKCPCCGNEHTWTQRNTGKKMTSYRFSECEIFKSIRTPDERAKLLEDAKGCYKCLDWSGKHLGRDCKSTLPDCHCGKKHNGILHLSKNPYVSHSGSLTSHVSVNVERIMSGVETVDPDSLVGTKAPTPAEIEQQNRNSANTMFLVEEVKFLTPSQDRVEDAEMTGNLFWDRGANFTVVRKAHAEALGLEGTDVCHDVVRTGGDGVEWNTKAYNVRIPGPDGDVKVLMAMGVDVISVPLRDVDLSHVADLFPEVDEIGDKLRRPVGNIDLMVGASHQELFPKEVERQGGIAIFQSSLTSTLLVSGAHPDVEMEESDCLTEETRRISQSHSQAVHTSHRTEIVNFIEAEEMGVEQPRRCVRVSRAGHD